MSLSKNCLFFLLLIASHGSAMAQREMPSEAQPVIVKAALPHVRWVAPVPDSMRERIEALNRQMMETFKRGDMLGVARFYADNATIFSYRGRKIEGRQAIDRYWTGIRSGRDWKLEVIEVGGQGDAVYQIGKSSLTTVSDGKENTYVCDFVVIWKRQPDGAYKIYVDIYN